MQNRTLATLLFWISGLTISLAGLSAPSSNAVLSTDGKRVLVMISPARKYDIKWPVRFSLPDGRSIILHETFPKSGAYDAGTLAPIWQADFFSLPWNLRWSPDFTDVVHINQFGLGGDRFGLEGDRSGPGSDWALKFYHLGQLTRSYRCQELLTGLKHPAFFPLSSWDWYQRWWEIFRVEQDHLELSTARRQLNFFGYILDLGLREHYTFDLSTGAMTARSSAGAERILNCGFVIMVICVFLSATLWFGTRSS